MNKRQLGRIGMAAITEEQARRDPAGAFHIALATMRAAHRAYVEREQAKARERALAAGDVPL
jgi:hypothetical protein